MSERVFCIYCRSELTSEDELKDQAHKFCKDEVKPKIEPYSGVLKINKDFIILIDSGNFFTIADNFNDLITQSGLNSRYFFKLFKEIAKTTGSKLDKIPVTNNKIKNTSIYPYLSSLVTRLTNDFEITSIYTDEDLKFRKKIFVYWSVSFELLEVFYNAFDHQFLKNHELLGYLSGGSGYFFIPKYLVTDKNDYTYHFNLNRIIDTIFRKLQLDNLELFISDNNIGELVIKSGQETLYFYFTVKPNLVKAVARRY